MWFYGFVRNPGFTGSAQDLYEQTSNINMNIRFLHNALGALAIISAISVTACNSDSPADKTLSINISPEILDFPNISETKEVKIQTNADSWNVSAAPDWTSITSGHDGISVEVSDNTGDERTGSIDLVFTLGTVSRTKSVIVSQDSDKTIKGDYVVFADAAFAEYILGYYDTDQDGKLSYAEADRITELDVADNTFKSLEGIRSFRNLASLECEYNALTSLDVSGLQKLQYLICDHNAITSLKFEGCTALTSIICEFNKIASISDAGKICKNLEFYNCQANELDGTLSVAGLEKLQHFYCARNELARINVSGCSSMTTLVCYTNQLSSLDLKGLSKINYLDCNSNRITVLDLTDQPLLQQLTCHTNLLNTLDLSSNTKMTSLSCYSNDLSSLDISKCKGLQILLCRSNKLSNLDLSTCPELTTVDAGANRLGTLNLSGCNNIVSLTCDNSSLSSLDLSGKTLLETLVCNDNILKSLDVSINTKLKKLHCQGNPLEKLIMATGQTISDLKIDDRSVIEYK